MNEYKIPLSAIPLRRQIVVSGIVVVLACLVTTLFFYFAVSIAPNLQHRLVITLWIGMLVLWALGAFAALKNHSKTSYLMLDQAFCIRKKGWLGKGSEYLYRYDMIVSVNSTSRAHGAYGSIELVFDQQKPVIVSGIVSPDKYARRIKELTQSSIK